MSDKLNECNGTIVFGASLKFEPLKFEAIILGATSDAEICHHL